MAKILGRNCVAYLFDGGASPDYVFDLTATSGVYTLVEADWTVATEITGLDIDGSTATADVSTRGGGGYRQTVGTVKEGAVSFQLFDESDPTLRVVQDQIDKAYRDGTNLTWLFANGDLFPTTATDAEDLRGFMATYSVTDFSESQQLEEAVTFNVSLGIASTNPTPGYYGVLTGGETIKLVGS